MAESAGFWSYVHADDTSDSGKIRRLAEVVGNEYSILTGEEINIFVDRSEISWGDQWRNRIDSALVGTTFFIPVVTPRYFKSPECRRELLTFSGHVKSLGMNQLIMPILYSKVKELSNPPKDDEAIALIAEYQWEDWRELRLADEGSSEYRRAVHRLASRLADIAESANAAEGVSTREIAVRQTEPESDTVDQEPGFIEVLAQGEEAIPRWGVALNEIGPVLVDIAGLLENSNLRLRESDGINGGFAGRLRVARNLAADLAEPAERVSDLGRLYAEELVNIDPAILTMIRMVEEEPENLQDPRVQEFFDQMLDLARNSRKNEPHMADYLRALARIRRVSRDLHAPIDMLVRGLRSMNDGNAVIAEWERRIREVRDDDDGSAAAPRA